MTKNTNRKQHLFRNTLKFKYLIYIIAVSIDLILTYIVTPDFKHEGNFIITYINSTWIQLSVFVYMAILLVIIGNSWAERTTKNTQNTTCGIKLIFTWILLTIFRAHLYYTAFVIINNTIITAYIKGTIVEPINRIANLYVEITSFKGTTLYFTHLALTISLVAATTSAYNIIKRYTIGNQQP